MSISQLKARNGEVFDENEMSATLVHQTEMGYPPEKTRSKPMNKLTAEVARQDLKHLKAWVESCGISMKEERYMQALELALPILEQKERGEGEWIEWGGGRCPVGDEVVVDVKFRDDCLAAMSRPAGSYYWGRSRITSDSDIIAYRIIPERTINRDGR